MKKVKTFILGAMTMSVALACVSCSGIRQKSANENVAKVDALLTEYFINENKILKDNVYRMQFYDRASRLRSMQDRKDLSDSKESVARENLEILIHALWNRVPFKEEENKRRKVHVSQDDSPSSQPNDRDANSDASVNSSKKTDTGVSIAKQQPKNGGGASGGGNKGDDKKTKPKPAEEIHRIWL